VVAGLAITLAVVVGALWWWRGWPSERMSIGFAVGADVTYTCVLLSCSDPGIALLACVWFFLVGDYLLAAHQHPSVVLHGAWVVANLVLFGTLSLLAAPDVDDVYVILLLLAIGSAVVVVPIFAQLFADTLRNTSRRSVELAHRDPLTRILNRRGLSAAVPRLFAQLTTDEQLVGVIVLDIDRFKIVNDVYGHQAGDTVLELLAQRLQRSVRKHGLVARMGGEEFVVIDRMAAEGLWPLAERLREVCNDTSDEVPITVSVGAVGMRAAEFPTSDAEELLGTLIDRADGAMYSAKQRGGNQVVLDPAMSELLAAAAIAATPTVPSAAGMVDWAEPDSAAALLAAERIFDDVVARRAGPEHQAS